MIHTNLQVQSLEEKVKKVGSELECQRHNAQAAQLMWEQKVKEKDKEHKAELSQQNDILRDMERQLDENRKKSEQEMNKVALPFKITPQFKTFYTSTAQYCCQSYRCPKVKMKTLFNVVYSFKVQAEQNQIRGQLEKAEHELTSVKKEKDELHKKLQSSEHAMNSYNSTVANFEAKVEKLQKEKASLSTENDMNPSRELCKLHNVSTLLLKNSNISLNT